MYPHHVFNLEPAGTFEMYPICYRQVSGRYFQPEPAMYSRCFRWFPGPLTPSVRKVWHPYQDSVGQCRCEPGGWCNDLPCASWVQRVPCKIWGHSSLNGGSQSGRSCCGTDKEPYDQPGSSCGRCTPTHALCLGNPELWTVGAGGWLRKSQHRIVWARRNGTALGVW